MKDVHGNDCVQHGGDKKQLGYGEPGRAEYQHGRYGRHYHEQGVEYIEPGDDPAEVGRLRPRLDQGVERNDVKAAESADQ